jgi:D-3-phosphoglycerate dehydrogenase
LLAARLRAAVNVPEMTFGSHADIAPLLNLAHRLARLLCGLARGSFKSLQVRYGGEHEEALPAVTAAAAQGLLCDIVDVPLTMVNALHVASDRGVRVTPAWIGSGAGDEERIELRLRTPDDSLSVAGVLLSENHPRVTRIGDYRVDIQPRGNIIVLSNRDVPGVIGRVGSVLGDAGINIAEYHQSRLEAGGDALATLTVDSTVQRSVIEQLASLEDVTGVWQIHLPEASAVSLSQSASAAAPGHDG